MKAIDIELAIIKTLFKPRVHLVVPNVSYGFNLNYEADLIVCTKSRYIYEIEIKTNKHDLYRDLHKKKWKYNQSYLIRKFYFAFPEELLIFEKDIPPRAGIITISDVDNIQYASYHRKSETNREAGKIDDKRYNELLRLAALRIWSLKIKLRKYQNEN